MADSFEILVDVNLRSEELDLNVAYGFTVGRAGPQVQEPFVVRGEHAEADGRVDRFVSHGDNSRLFLPVRLPRAHVLAPLDAALRSMRFYELDSTVLRELVTPTATSPALGPAGDQLGPVLGALAADKTGKERFDAYVSALVPGALGVDERREGRYSTVQARFRGSDGIGEATFQREELSEGTVRAAGVLAALFQAPILDGRIPLIGIEEPETALHPAGVGALYEAFDDAAARTQVIVTTQSSDLFDSEYASLDHIRVVSNVDGATQVGEVDAAGRAIVEKGLMSISELHRSGQMRPAPPSAASDEGSEPT
jgi:predicted ATPase